MAYALTLAVAIVFGLFGLLIACARGRARERDRADASLRQMSEALEARVRVRTAGLVADNEALRRELAGLAQRESKLGASEERYRALVTAWVPRVWLATAARELDAESAGLAGHADPVPDGVPGRWWPDAVHPEDREPFARAWADAHAGRRAFEAEHRLWHADGTYRRTAVLAVPLLNEDGSVREWVGAHAPAGTTALDGPAEACALQLEHLPLAYLLCDAANRYIYWNRAAERMFGFSRSEALGKRPFEVIVPERERGAAEALFARLATGEPDARGVFENVTKSGRDLVCEWHHAPLFDAAGAFQGVLSLAQDVTARHRHGERLTQAQKMDAICQLAGGVAHDFNNLLTIINGYTRMLASACPVGTPAGEALGEVRAASERATELTRQLLAFGRLQVLRPRVLNVNGLVTEAQKVIAKLVGEGVQVKCALAPNLGLVSADPDQIEQVLANLCAQARDAMPNGGRLALTTDAVTVTTDTAAEHADLHPGRYVRLAVADTGYGMTPDVRLKIFEPFFSTKGVGKGAGLALASVYGIVKQSGGHIAVDSTIGAGTTFTVYLPVAAAVAPLAASLVTPEPRPGGGDTILLVEDERPVRALAALALREAGYTVLEAARGEDAVALFNARPGARLLLTDVVMPGMSGRELAEALREQNPDLRLIYMSGYTDDAQVRYEIAAANSEFLQKPFEVDELLLKVRQVLDEAPVPASGQALTGATQ
ncbi:PAS domain-containing protein [Gemmata sp. JC717]|uniref:hybrid sensor histidine kinase/response regulator n=1 Tax=Gemmata algarum TaxID=2975278 RepID=UPI0021BB3645|nr:PAS domain-containing hybrid sensor histidine kinase/response regulator [Gemmata algarum]MDY3554902.1 PAS domain-containing protein [Gemmata algarum]